ncbi:hypothetical protein CPB86DRAFT_672239, partial [Serendipita vermifera]
ASLCLACCSNILQPSAVSFTTNCCNKPICAACLNRNPRLRLYDPCLACCGGVQVV